MLTIARYYWKEILLGIVILGMVAYIQILRMNVIEAQGRNKTLQGKLDVISAKIEANRVQYEANMKRYEEKDLETTIKWKTRYETIYVWRDANVSCEDAMSRFDSTVY